MRRIIVMAEGAGDRWNALRSHAALRLSWLPEYKHWLDAGGESIIGRTARMLAEADVPYDDVTFFAPMSFAHAVWPFDRVAITGFLLGEIGPLLEGIGTVRNFWGSARTICLLGDVLFSRDVLGAILNDSSPLKFFGRVQPNPLTGKEASELFGFAANSEFYEEIMAICFDLTRRGRGEKCAAKLWDLYRAMGEPEILKSPDYTDDVDSPEEYKRFWPKLQHAAIHDREESQ